MVILAQGLDRGAGQWLRGGDALLGSGRSGAGVRRGRGRCEAPSRIGVEDSWRRGLIEGLAESVTGVDLMPGGFVVADMASLAAVLLPLRNVNGETWTRGFGARLLFRSAGRDVRCSFY